MAEDIIGQSIKSHRIVEWLGAGGIGVIVFSVDDYRPMSNGNRTFGLYADTLWCNDAPGHGESWVQSGDAVFRGAVAARGEIQAVQSCNTARLRG